MGNSNLSRSCLRREMVHPHVHGELSFGIPEYPRSAGSSPRAWGTLTSTSGNRTCGRFIPTCMGNSLTALLEDPEILVHPHVHGELTLSCSLTKMVSGSSPRAWGTLATEGDQGDLIRFIPTCMGNSLLVSLPDSISAVHPHVHGELNSDHQKRPLSAGSSPRAWGTLCASP